MVYWYAILKKILMEQPGALHPTWYTWVEFLRKHKLETMATWALEALGPLAVLSAQVVHAGSPFLRPALSGAQVEAITSLLEDPNEARAFTALLREDTAHGK